MEHKKSTVLTHLGVNNVLEVFQWEVKGLYVNKHTVIEDSIFDINRKLLTHFTVRILSEEISLKSRNFQVNIEVCLRLKNKLGKGLQEGRLPNQHGTYPWVNISFLCVLIFLSSFLFVYSILIILFYGQNFFLDIYILSSRPENSIVSVKGLI